MISEQLSNSKSALGVSKNKKNSPTSFKMSFGRLGRDGQLSEGWLPPAPAGEAAAGRGRGDGGGVDAAAHQRELHRTYARPHGADT